MKLSTIQEKLKAGTRLLVNVPNSANRNYLTYNLEQGGAVTPAQFENLKDDLTPCDPSLLPGEGPQSYVWGSAK